MVKRFEDLTMRDSKGLQVLWQREYNQRSFKVKRDGVKGEGITNEVSRYKTTALT